MRSLLRSGRFTIGMVDKIELPINGDTKVNFRVSETDVDARSTVPFPCENDGLHFLEFSFFSTCKRSPVVSSELLQLCSELS